MFVRNPAKYKKGTFSLKPTINVLRTRQQNKKNILVEVLLGFVPRKCTFPVVVGDFVLLNKTHNRILSLFHDVAKNKNFALLQLHKSADDQELVKAFEEKLNKTPLGECF